MTDKPDRAEMTELDAELKECLEAGEYLDALDICEEIEEKGAMEVRHWLAMARCLVELRRKADARRAWLKVLETEPEHKVALEGLNKHFPGWRSQVARSAREASAKKAVPGRLASPPVAAAPSATSAAPAAPAASASPKPSPAPSPSPSPSRPAAPAASSAAGASGRTAAAAAPSGGMSDGLVNWNYVLEDVAEAEVERARR